jgi:hypothetical protein
MSASELSEFLGETRYVACTSIAKDGSPITVFLGFEWFDDAMWFGVRNSRWLCSRLERDPRVSLAVTNEQFPPVYVTMRGSAEVIDDSDRSLTKRIFMKYKDPKHEHQRRKDIDLAAEWGAYFDVGRTLYRVVPTVIISEDGAKWQPGSAGVSDQVAREKGLVPSADA